MPALTHGRSYVCYSRRGSQGEMGKDFDATGRLSRSVFDEAGVPRDAIIVLDLKPPAEATLKALLPL